MPASFMFCRFLPIMIPLRSLTNKNTSQQHSGYSIGSSQFFRILRSFTSVTLWMLVLLVLIPVQVSGQKELDVPQLSIQTQSYLHNPEAGTY
ncbi:MAG: hypothetical protein ACKVJ3_07545, partial [bacterium]